MHSLPENLATEAGDLGWEAAAIIGGSFLVAGFVAYLTVSGMIPKKTGIIQFFLQGKAPGMDAPDTKMCWFLIFSFLLFVAFSFLWVWGGQLLVYLSIRNLRALPPLSAGGKSRCHLCGSDLPDTGLVRKCEHCSCDNLVDGAFMQSAPSLQVMLSQFETAAHKHIGTSINRIGNGIMYAAGLPFLLILIAPLSWAFHSTLPHLVWLPGAIFALAVIVRISALIARPKAP